MVLCLIAPALAGGCPDFRNDVVDSVAVATEGVLLNDADPQDATQTVVLNVLSSAMGLFFDQYRPDEFR